jgi:hypothetical protein
MRQPIEKDLPIFFIGGMNPAGQVYARIDAICYVTGWIPYQVRIGGAEPCVSSL